MHGYYKHSAPLEPGGDGNAWVLQTFGSAGAGRGWKCMGTTNIRLRWSREGMEMPGYYKHSAPLEPAGDGDAWVLQTFGSAGAGRDEGGTLEEDARSRDASVKYPSDRRSAKKARSSLQERRQGHSYLRAFSVPWNQPARRSRYTRRHSTRSHSALRTCLI